MAVIETSSIPSEAVLQPDDTDVTSSSGRSISQTYKGPYNDLKTFKDSIKIGDELSGKVISNVSLRRAPGDLGLLELTLSYQNTATEGEVTAAIAERAVWTCKSVRNDKSILAYCGPSLGGNPNRAWIESWMAERDADIASDGNYKKDDGSIAKLDDQTHKEPTLALIGKINSGIDSVVRFYPVITCTRIYAKIPSNFLEDVGYINSPAARAANEVHAPDNLASIIASFNWLKVQDDVAETGDGKWQRVESWMGSDNAWDADLYGENRWTMPYNA